MKHYTKVGQSLETRQKSQESRERRKRIEGELGFSLKGYKLKK